MFLTTTITTTTALQHTKSMHSMAREQEALSSQSAVTHSSELRAQQSQHTTLMAQIKETHASEMVWGGEGGGVHCLCTEGFDVCVLSALCV